MYTTLNRRNAVSPYPSLQLRYDFLCRSTADKKGPKGHKKLDNWGHKSLFSSHVHARMFQIFGFIKRGDKG